MTTPLYAPPPSAPPGLPTAQLFPAPYQLVPRPPRSGLRLGIVALVMTAAIVILETTLPATAAVARHNAYPLPRISITTSATPSSRVGDQLQFSASPQAGRDLTYSWDFGDGASASGQVVTHAYSAYQSGGYTVVVVASDPLRQSASQEMNVTVLPIPPQACFTTTPDANYVITADFDATCSTGTELSYQWNYGDNSTDQGVQVTHQYSQPGSYTVRLTVTDVANQQASVTHVVRVTVAPPVGRFTATPDTYDPCYVSFDASSSSGYGIGTYSWDFGDGQTESDGGPFTSHFYGYSASFTVTLTVVDQFGQQGNTSQVVNISGC